MAKPLVFLMGDEELAFHLNKVDRSKLYGSKGVEVLDEHDSVCELATLADDGCTMIGKGGTALGWIDVDGQWRAKTELKPFDVNGDEVQPVASSFNAPVKLFETATAEDYLDHNIRLVYRLELADEATSIDDLINELKRGTLFKFAYSYRGGLEADAAFLLLNEDEELMMVVGKPADIVMIGMQSQAPELDESEDGAEAEDGLMDFDMI